MRSRLASLVHAAPRRLKLLPSALVLLVACEQSSPPGGEHPAPEGSAGLADPTPPAPPEPRAPETSDGPAAPARLGLGLEPRTPGIGERALAPHYALLLTDTKECRTEPPFEPKPDHVILGALVTIEALGDMQVPANSFYASIVDSTHVVHESTLAGCQPPLPARQLVRGERATGWISFELPRAARGLRLVYAPLLLGVGREELSFQLNR